MHRMIATVVTSLAFVSLAFAQMPGGAAASSTDTDEQMIIKSQEEWADALVNRDFSVIDRVVAPDWQITLPDGTVSTKAQVDADMKSGVIVFESFKIDDLKVRVDGNTAIAFGLETEKSSYKGEDTSGQYRYTDIYVKRDGKWLCIATHMSKVPEQQMSK